MPKEMLEAAIQRADAARAEALASARQQYAEAIAVASRRFDAGKLHVSDLPPAELAARIAELEEELRVAYAVAWCIRAAEISAADAVWVALTTALWEEEARVAASTGDAEWTRQIAMRAAREAYEGARLAAGQGKPQDYNAAIAAAASARDAAHRAANAAFADATREEEKAKEEKA